MNPLHLLSNAAARAAASSKLLRRLGFRSTCRIGVGRHYGFGEDLQPPRGPALWPTRAGLSETSLEQFFGHRTAVLNCQFPAHDEFEIVGKVSDPATPQRESHRIRV